jgi:N-acetylmuramoyl-L-alanine amidase
MAGGFRAWYGATLLGAGMCVPLVLSAPDAPQRPAVPATPSATPIGHPAGWSAQVADSEGQAIDPAAFSQGACMAFGPTSGDRHETVFLDAGHGGADPGGVGSTLGGATVDESKVNLAIELDAMAVLRTQGYRVVVSRTQNTTVTKLTPADVSGQLLTARGAFSDVAARAVCANMAGADLLIGIYMDSGNPSNAGCVTGYDASRSFAAENLKLATLVQDDVLGALNGQGYGIPSEGVQPDSGLGSAITAAARAYGHLLLLGPAKAGYFSTPSQMPGALIEPLFITDPFEGSIADSGGGQEVIAGGVAAAVGQYSGSALPCLFEACLFGLC